MPADDSLGLDDDQSLPPARPPAAKSEPEGAIRQSDPRSGVFPFEKRHLLAQDQILKRQVGARAKQGTSELKRCGKEPSHRPRLPKAAAPRNFSPAVCVTIGLGNSLTCKADEVLARHRWRTFLANHRDVIAAIDFFTSTTVTFRVLDVFFVIHHARRAVLHVRATAHPTVAWITPQLREAFPYETAPTYLILDRDAKCSADVLVS